MHVPIAAGDSGGADQNVPVPIAAMVELLICLFNSALVFEVYVPRFCVVTIREYLTETAAPFGYRSGAPR
jgi:predicted ABC-type sugar transport system permease subunit